LILFKFFALYFMIEGLCMPALIYLIYATTRIIIDAYKGLYNMAFVQVWITILFVYLLNVLCRAGFGIISWIVVSIPFLLMSVIAAVLLFVFGLNPATGKAVYAPQAQPPPANSAQVNTVGYTTTSAPSTVGQMSQPPASGQPPSTQPTSGSPPTTQLTSEPPPSTQPTSGSPPSTQPTSGPSPSPDQPMSGQPSSVQPSTANTSASQPTFFNQHPMTNSPLPVSVKVEKFTDYKGWLGNSRRPTPYG
jgi:hypothetical protein